MGRTLSPDMDVRGGGVWQFVMHGLDRIDYQNKIVCVEVKQPERLVYTHTGGAEFETTVTFDDKDGKTEIA